MASMTDAARNGSKRSAAKSKRRAVAARRSSSLTCGASEVRKFLSPLERVDLLINNAGWPGWNIDQRQRG